MSTDLVTWLRQQLDAIESETRTLLYWVQQTILTLQDPKLLGKHIPGWHDWPKVERMCIARLAEVDAKRRILDEYERALERRKRHPDDPASAGALLAMLLVVKMQALPYADRPGYRQEWAP